MPRCLLGPAFLLRLHVPEHGICEAQVPRLQHADHSVQRGHLLGGAPVVRIYPGVSSELQKHLHGFQVAPKGRSVERGPAEGALAVGTGALLGQQLNGQGLPARRRLGQWRVPAAVLKIHQGQAPLQPPRRSRRVATHALTGQQLVHLPQDRLDLAQVPVEGRLQQARPAQPLLLPPPLGRSRFLLPPPGRLLLAPNLGHEGLPLQLLHQLLVVLMLLLTAGQLLSRQEFPEGTLDDGGCSVLRGWPCRGLRALQGRAPHALWAGLPLRLAALSGFP